MAQDGVFIYPDAARSASSVDPNLLLAMNQNGGFGGNGGWWWILFLWAMWQNGSFQNFRNGGGSFSELAAQMNSDQGRQYLSEIMAGRFDNLNNLAQILNSSIESVKTGIFTVQSQIQNVASQVGMSALQVQNSIERGNAGLAQQLCQCCCENRLAIATQTSALQAQAASNFAATQLQLAQNEAADQLAVCQQTNALSTQALNNTNSILGAIKDQNTMITAEFCALKERELQNKIDTQGEIITQLRNQISNDHQTLQFNAAFHALDDKIDAIAAKQPNTVPVQWPQLTAVNNTPNIGQTFYPGYFGYGYPQNSFWN